MASVFSLQMNSFPFTYQPIMYLVKTGETEDNPTGVLDVPLSSDGLNAAVEAAWYISFTPIMKVYTSDLISAMQTAEAISGNKDFIRDAALRTCSQDTLDHYMVKAMHLGPIVLVVNQLDGVLPGGIRRFWADGRTHTYGENSDINSKVS